MKNINKFQIYLRAFEPDDYKTTIKWRNDDKTSSMVGGLKRYVSSENEKKWVNDNIFSKKDIRLCICLKETNELVGFVALIDFDKFNRSCQASIMIGNKEHRNKGFASEAIFLILDYAFNQLNCNRVYALILERNLSSRKIFVKCGYQIEGVLRKSIYKDGKYQNQVIMSILKDEFLKLINESNLNGN